MTPYTPLSHPFGQLPLTWLHCFLSLQCPHVVLHSNPYVLFTHSAIYIKPMASHLKIYINSADFTHWCNKYNARLFLWLCKQLCSIIDFDLLNEIAQLFVYSCCCNCVEKSNRLSCWMLIKLAPMKCCLAFKDFIQIIIYAWYRVHSIHSFLYRTMINSSMTNLVLE